MKVLITGGSGFIGSHCADALVQRGDEVTIFDNRPRIHEFNAAYIAGDLLDREQVHAAIKGNDFVIHAGGILGTHETIVAASETSRNIILGGLNILDAVRRHGVNLISISKPNVWLNPYSIAKDCLEKFCFMYANEFDCQIAILKLFNAYGPRQKFSGVQKAIPTWIVSALQRRPLDVYGEGTSTMDLIFVKDAVDGIVATLDSFEKTRIRGRSEIAQNYCGDFQAYNEQMLELGSGEEISVNNAIKELEVVFGLPVVVRHVPMRRGEVDGTRLRANISKLCAMTGYSPKVSLQDGFKETILYYQENLPLIRQGKL